MVPIQFRALLKTLVEHEVDFVVVGGLAAVLQGAPIHTQDVDILYSRVPDNVLRIDAAMRSIDAVFRGDRRKLRPNPSHFESTGHKLLDTRLGPVDCLGTIEESTGYDDVLPDTDEIDLEDLVVRVISLPRLIRVKEKLHRPKDQLMLLQLRATLEERDKLR